MTPHRPSFEDFACRAGQAPCVPVYRQLTGDGLTPVSAFRRIERTAPSFLFESVIGGEKVGRFSFLGTEPFLRFEARGDEVAVDVGERPRGRPPLHVGRPVPRAPGAGRALSGGPPAGPPSVRRGRGRLRRLRRRPLHRAPPQRPARRPRPARPLVRLLRPDGPVRPHPQDHPGRRAGPPRAGRRPPRRLRPRLRPGRRAGRPAGRARHRAGPRRHRHRRPGPARPAVELHPRAIRGGRPPLPGIHQGRRHLPGGPQPAVPGRDLGRAVRHLPGAPGRQPQPVPVLPALRRLLPDRQLARDPGPGRGRDGHDPAAGRHPAPGPGRGRGPGAGRGAPGRPQGARRAHHARRPRPQRRRPGRRLRDRAVDRRDEGRAVLARHAHHLERDRPARRGQDGLRRPPCRAAGGDGLGRPEGPRHADHRRGRAAAAAGPTPAPSATSTSPATWTPASPCGPSSSRARPPTSRPAAASSTTASRRTSTRRRSTRPRGLLKAIEIAETQF